jgi:hypothetical protein
MKGRTFETFEVTAGNREAFDHCRRIALLEDMGPSLALLLGPEGCGKSHLLWAVAKQVRLSTIPVGLALITPQEFPDKVRDLVEEPRALVGRRAVLLVDNLEGFEADARRLEALIDTFLTHQHPVLIASNVHPNRLRQLSGPLRARFARSLSIIMEPRPAGGAGPVETYEKFQVLERRIAELEAERDQLNEKLRVAFATAEDLAKETVAIAGRVRALQEEADFAMAQQARTQIALSDARLQLEESAMLRETLAERDEALARAQADLEGIAGLRAALVERDETLSAAQAEIVALKETLAGRDRDLAEVRALLEESSGLHDALADRDAALSEARADLEALEALRSAVAERDQALSEAEACVACALDRIEEMREAHAVHRDELLANISVLAVDLARPDHEAPLLRALAEAGREQEYVRTALAATRERMKQVEFEWEKTRKVLAIQTAEMDALRYAAANQVATATIQAGEMEHRIDTLESALFELEAAAREAAREFPGEAPTLRILRAALDHMQAQVRAIQSVRRAGRATPGPSELSLFDTEFFEALPDDFQAPGGDGRQGVLPGLGEGFRSVVENALAGGAENVREAEIERAERDRHE